MTTPDELHRFQGDPREAIQGEDYFAVGSTAKHKYGVLYKGPWETLHDGTCRAVRLHARALASTGVPVLLQSFNHTVIREGIPAPVFEAGLDETVQREVGGMTQASVETTVPLIKHMIPRNAQALRNALVPRSMVTNDIETTAKLHQFVLRSNIVYTVWECDKIPSDIANVLSQAGQCWVPCRQNAVALEAGGVPPSRIRVVPHPYDPESRLAVEGPKRPQCEQRRFLSIGIWQPRKALHELLGCFLRTFKPEDDATLTIKTTPTKWPNYPTVQESVRHWLDDACIMKNGWSRETMKGRVRIITKRLTDDEMVDLHLQNNIYVSAGHGEAWCLPAFDSKVAGNRMVHVPFGGTADFCDARDVEVPYKLGAVDASYHWQDGSQWAQYEICDLERALRSIEPTTFWPERSWRFEVAFSIERVGKMMLDNVLELTRDVMPEAAEALERAANLPESG